MVLCTWDLHPFSFILTFHSSNRPVRCFSRNCHHRIPINRIYSWSTPSCPHHPGVWFIRVLIHSVWYPEYVCTNPTGSSWRRYLIVPPISIWIISTPICRTLFPSFSDSLLTSVSSLSFFMEVPGITRNRVFDISRFVLDLSSETLYPVPDPYPDLATPFFMFPTHVPRGFRTHDLQLIRLML